MDDSTDPPTNTSLDVMEVSPTAPDTTDVAPPDDPDVLNTTPVPTPSPTQQSGAMVGALENEDNRDTEFVYVLRRYNTILDNKVHSPWHIFGGFRWRLLIFPRGNQTSSHDLSVYLECGGPVSRTAGGDDLSEYAGIGNGKEIAMGGVANVPWSRPAKFSLHLVHPMSPIGRAHLRRETENENALSDVDVTDSNMGRGGVGGGVLVSRNDITKETSHIFKESASDWGFLEFAPFTSLQPKHYADDDMNVVIMVRIRLQDNLNDAMFNNTVTWDSRKETGFVGFKNQGATCYMNSLLQSLYMVSAFRKAVYNMPLPDSGNDNSGSELSYALQKVFFELQFSPTVVKTKKLTESFGWDTTDAFTQHDVQELKLILCDELAEKMKKIAPDQPNTLSTLFQGKLLNYIECVNVDYKSTREEHFSDLSLNVKGCRNIYESFDKYVEVEMMEGDNKYRADGYEDLQDAKKGVKFLSLPPVLQLHLKRFEYDFSRYAMVKINDRYEFETELDLNRYVENSDGSNIYVLHSVLVHIGDVNGGHYHVFIRPDIDVGDTGPKKASQWYKFDDETVSLATEEAAVIDNFGVGGEKDFTAKRVSGIDDDLGNGGLNGQIPPPSVFQTRNRNYQTRRFSNAYMLQYLRKSEAPYLLKPQDELDVPKELAARIRKERVEEEQKKKERTDQHLFMDIAVAVNENMVEHHGSDLVQWDKVRQLHVKRAMLLGELKIRLQKEGIVKDARFMRLWKCSGRRNDSIRPDSLVADGIDTQPISDPKHRDHLTHTGYNMSLYSGRLGYYGQENVVRMYAEDFCSPYCLAAGEAYLQFVKRESQLNGEYQKADDNSLVENHQHISEMETDTLRMYALPQIPTFQLVYGKEVLLFVKFYTPTPAPRLQWLGQIVVDRGMTVNDLHPLLRNALFSYRKRDPSLPGIDENTDIFVFEEVSAMNVAHLEGTKTLEDHRIPLESDSGDILMFQGDIFSYGRSNRSNRVVSNELSDSSYGEDSEWDGLQEQSRGDGTDLPLGGRPLPTVNQYFDYLVYRIKVEFKDKATIGGPDENKSIFFEMLRKDKYAVARGVLAGALGSDTHPDYLRFFAHDQTRETAAQEPLRLRDTDELQRVFPMHSMVTPGQPEYGILWYERTEYHISEFDKKDEVRVVWRQDGGTHATPYSSTSTHSDSRATQPSNDSIIRADVSVSVSADEHDDKLMNANDTSNGQMSPSAGNNLSNDTCKSFSVLVPSNSKYADVMDQVRIKLRISGDVDIRMFEVKSSKILRSICPEDSVPPLMTGPQDCGAELRAEPIPEDETEEALGNKYELMTVVHLAKDKQPRVWRGVTCFGVPFVIKVKRDGEPVRVIRERIREKLGVSEEEFEQWPLAEIVQLKVMYLHMMDVVYKPHPRSSMEFCTLAIEHKSTAPAKRTSLAISRYADKPLKIRS